MEIKLYKFAKRIDSTKRPNENVVVLTKSVLLKADTSIYSPTFIINDDISGYNYLEWDNRFYYINDVIKMNVHNTWEIVCSFDVLASAKEDILASSQYVTRSASNYDTSIIDNIYPTKSGCSIVTTTHDSVWKSNLSEGVYVVGVVGAVASGVTYYTLNQTNFTTMLNNLFGSQEDVLSVLGASVVKSIQDPMNFITSCVWIPTPAFGGSSGAMRVGWWSNVVTASYFTGAGRYENNAEISIPKHPQASARGSFMNGAPFSQYLLEFEPFGTIALDANLLHSIDTLHLRYSVNLINGMGTLLISTDSASTNIIATAHAQVGVPIQISRVASDLSLAGSSILTSAGSVLSGNILGMTGGILSSINSLMPRPTTNGSNTGFSTYHIPIKLVGTFYNVTNADYEHFGRPLMQKVTLSTLSGYVQTENASVDTSLPEVYKDSINTALNGGVYLE